MGASLRPVGDALAGVSGIELAADYPQLAQVQQWLKVGSPNTVLEGRLSNDSDPGVQEQTESCEEKRQGPLGQWVARGRLEAVTDGVDHALFDLIPTDGDTSDGVAKQMRQGGLAGPRWTRH